MFLREHLSLVEKKPGGNTVDSHDENRNVITLKAVCHAILSNSKTGTIHPKIINNSLKHKKESYKIQETCTELRMVNIR